MSSEQPIRTCERCGHLEIEHSRTGVCSSIERCVCSVSPRRNGNHSDHLVSSNPALSGEAINKEIRSFFARRLEGPPWPAHETRVTVRPAEPETDETRMVLGCVGVILTVVVVGCVIAHIWTDDRRWLITAGIFLAVQLTLVAAALLRKARS